MLLSMISHLVIIKSNTTKVLWSLIALRLPVTYDSDLIQSHPIQPTKPLWSTKQALDWSESTSNDPQWLTDWLTDSSQPIGSSFAVGTRVPILMSISRTKKSEKTEKTEKLEKTEKGWRGQGGVRSSRTFDLLFHMIIDINRPIDLRWLLMSGAIFIIRWSCFQAVGIYSWALCDNSKKY